MHHDKASKIKIKNEKRKELILKGNLWKSVALITLPLAIYSFFNYLYGLIDMLMVAHIGSNEVSSVVFIDEIKSAISAFGVAIAAAGSVIVARHYGANNVEEARKNAGTSFIMAVLISLCVVLITVSLGAPILRLVGATPEIIETGLSYYNLQMISTALVAVNSVFIGLEKAKGNTALVLYLNLIVMAVKLLLSWLFVFVFGGGISSVAVATLIAQGILTLLALAIMFNKNNIFKIKLSDIKLKMSYVKPIIVLAIPVFIGRFLFNMGKVSINGIALAYHPYAVAGLGVAMRLHGAFSSVVSVFEESEMSIVSQNLGNRRLDRAIKTFKISIFLAMCVAAVGFVGNQLLKEVLIPLFSQNPEEIKIIRILFRWEQFSMITSGALAIINGFFIGFKKTKITMFFNIVRIFVIRLPLLWLFTIIFPVGLETVWLIGLVMFISNTVIVTIGGISAFLFIRKIKNFGYEGMLLTKNNTEEVQI